MSEEVNKTEGVYGGYGCYGYAGYNNIWIWIIIGIIVLCLLCGDDFFGFGRRCY